MCMGQQQNTSSQQNGMQAQWGWGKNSYDPWVDAAGQNIYGGASRLPTQLPQDFLKAQGWASNQLGKTDPYTGAAGAWATANNGQVNPYTSGAAGMVGQANNNTSALMQALNPNASVQSYVNPYVAQTLTAPIANVNQALAQQNQRAGANAALAGAYGGTAGGVERALNNQLANREISNLSANAYKNAYDSALQQQLANRSLYGQMAGQQGQLGNIMSGIGQNAYGQQNATAQLLNQLGQNRYGQQSGLASLLAGLSTTGYTLPMQQYSKLAGILNMTPKNAYNLYGGVGNNIQYGNQQSSSSGGLGGILGSLLGGLL